MAEVTKTLKEERALHQLFKRDPHCYYCGRLTRLIPHEGAFTEVGRAYPLDMATKDHKYFKNHPYRQTADYNNSPWEDRYVLACRECNQIKGAIESSKGDLMNKREIAVKHFIIIEKMIQFEQT